MARANPSLPAAACRYYDGHRAFLTAGTIFIIVFSLAYFFLIFFSEVLGLELAWLKRCLGESKVFVKKGGGLANAMKANLGKVGNTLRMRKGGKKAAQGRIEPH